MKPDAWIQSNHLPVKAAAMCRLADHKLMSDFLPLYSAETIRKWLEEEPSEAMIGDGLRIICNAGSLVSASEVFEEMIAAKLEELK